MSRSRWTSCRSRSVPPSSGSARIRTFYFLSTGVGVLGFALIAIPIQFNLLLEDKYAMGPFERGVVESLIWVASLVGLPVAGRLFDRGFRRDPAAMMRLAGMLVMASGVVYAVGLPIKILGGLVVLMAVAQTMISMAFVAAPSVIAAVSPYRIRAQAFALLPVFVFLMGGLLRRADRRPTLRRLQRAHRHADRRTSRLL